MRSFLLRAALWRDYSHSARKLTYLWCCSTSICVMQAARPLGKGVSPKDASERNELSLGQLWLKKAGYRGRYTKRLLLGSAGSVLGEGTVMVW